MEQIITTDSQGNILNRFFIKLEPNDVDEKNAENGIIRDDCTDFVQERIEPVPIKIENEPFVSDEESYDASETDHISDNENSNPCSSVERQPEKKKRPRAMKCHICDTTLPSRRDLKDHLESHEVMLPYKCSQCSTDENPLICTRLNQLNNHFQSHGFKYVCPQCPLRFRSEKSLPDHTKSVHSGRKYNCGTCGNAFTNIDEFRKHVHSHKRSNKIRYTCEVCQERFPTSRVLKKHKAKHAKRSLVSMGKTVKKTTPETDRIENSLEQKEPNENDRVEDLNSIAKPGSNDVDSTINYDEPMIMGSNDDASFVVKQEQVCPESGPFVADSSTEYVEPIIMGSNDEASCAMKQEEVRPEGQPQPEEYPKELETIPNNCYICDTLLENDTDFDDHLELHRDMLPYKCTKCSTETNPKNLYTVLSLNKHFETHGFRYICPHCPLRHRNEGSHSYHIQSMHTDKGKVVLESSEQQGPKRKANKRKSSDSKRKANKKKSNEEQDPKRKTNKDKSSEVQDVCPQSPLRSSSENSLPYQTKSIHNGIKCKICEKVLINIGEFRKHMHSHKNAKKKRYTCESCQVDFPTSRHLRTHKAKHAKLSLVSASKTVKETQPETDRFENSSKQTVCDLNSIVKSEPIDVDSTSDHDDAMIIGSDNEASCLIKQEVCSEPRPIDVESTIDSDVPMIIGCNAIKQEEVCPVQAPIDVDSTIDYNESIISGSKDETNVVMKQEQACPEPGPNIGFNGEASLAIKQEICPESRPIDVDNIIDYDESMIIESNNGASYARNQDAVRPEVLTQPGVDPKELETIPNNCYICDTFLESEAAFNDHLEYHRDMLPYKCTQCSTEANPKNLYTVLSLNKHFETHGFRYICPHCPLRHRNESSYSYHIQSMHTDRGKVMLESSEEQQPKRKAKRSRGKKGERNKQSTQHKCAFCSKYFYTRRKLWMHTNKTHKEWPSLDNRSTGNGSAVDQSTAVDALADPGVKKPTPKSLPKKAKTVAKRVQHKKANKEAATLDALPIMDTSAVNASTTPVVEELPSESPPKKVRIATVRLHHHRSNRNAPSPNTPPVMNIDVGVGPSAPGNAVYKHLEIVETIPNKCYICDTVLESDSNFKYHLKSHRRMLPFKCSQCSTETNPIRASTVLALNNHFERHSFKFLCEFCPLRYRTGKALTIHIKSIHQAQIGPRYYCEICGKSFPDKCVYLSHVQDHKDLMALRYKCEACQQSFATNFFLQKHRATDTCLRNTEIKSLLDSAKNSKSLLGEEGGTSETTGMMNTPENHGDILKSKETYDALIHEEMKEEPIEIKNEPYDDDDEAQHNSLTIHLVEEITNGASDSSNIAFP